MTRSDSRLTRAAGLAATPLLIFVGGLSVYTLNRISALGGSVREALRVDSVVMQTLESTWVSGGVSRTITTTRTESESAGDFIARHAAAEAAAREVWPKDPAAPK